MYIYAHKFVLLLLDNEKTDQDMCNALWITKDRYIPKVNVISSYWDGSSPNLAEALIKGLETGKRLNNEMIIGMDRNVHTDLIAFLEFYQKIPF